MSIKFGKNDMFAFVNLFVFTLSDAHELCLFVSMAGPVTWVAAFSITNFDRSPILEIAVAVYHTVLIRANPLSVSH